jgi:hypothetical protein
MAEIADFSAKDTTFRINDDGTLVANVAMSGLASVSAGDLTATDDLIVGDDATITGDVSAANVLGTGIAAVPVQGSIAGGLALQCVDSGVITLDTGDAATDLTVDIPDGWVVAGVSLKVTTAITGVDSTTATIALTGGSTSTVTTFTTLTADYVKATMINPILVAFGGSNAGAALTLSGGADNTPTAGAVRVVLYCWAPQEL